MQRFKAIFAKPIAIQDAISLAFVRTWSWLPVALNDLFASLLVTLPICWLVYAYGFAASRCIEIKAAGPCLLLFSIGPIVLALPPIFHEEEEPARTYGLETVALALLLAVSWTALRSWGGARRKFHTRQVP